MDASSNMGTLNDVDRVRARTPEEMNVRIDQETEARIRHYATQPKTVITTRIEELDHEWDIERMLELNASGLAIVGIGAAAVAGRKWLVLPGLMLGFLVQHAVQGWCPPVRVFRALGVRTRKEIERERYALKLLRGDFDSFHSGEKPEMRRIMEIIDL